MLTTHPAWAFGAPLTPVHGGGGLVDGAHAVDVDATQANGGSGSKPKETAGGWNPPPLGDVPERFSGKQFVGFNAATSARIQEGASAHGGIGQQILSGLQTRADAAELIDWDVSVDSTITRAHQHAAGAGTRAQEQKQPPGGVDDEPADHALGRSRGGLSPDQGDNPDQGRPGRQSVQERAQRRSAASLRPGNLQAAPRRGVRYQSDQTKRGLATRYDKLAVRYQATFHIAAINEWL